jgi:hypothetical protein
VGSWNTLLQVICLTGIVTYLWRYFGFVGFDLNKFKPAPAASRVWNILLAVGFPLLGLLSSFKDGTKKTLVGIGISTILIPALIPDLDPPESDSLVRRIYSQTIGKGVADFLMGLFFNLALFVCWLLGPFWVAAYSGIAIFLAVSRSMWVRIQDQGHPSEAAPSIRSLLMIFAATFGWIVVLTSMMPLTRKEAGSDLHELYRPVLLTIVGSWVLARFPRLVFVQWFFQFRRWVA